ncbi:MAG: recombinase family protein [Candidatus Omnitrophica bacterium]|nr:recombinase family protein [Candidatus Omnitrophota bacterium]
MKLCGLYIRVSTEKQAQVEEGSLKNQDHHLTQHVQMKSQLGKEPWTIVERYVDEGISAKNTNRPAYQKMIEDIKRGRINTVLCLALSRISRSTRDLLDLVDFFRQHQVDFICLKEDVDTTSPMGRLLLTFMGGLNQFEREQCGDRTRSAILARAERGLWNGGQIFGYDVDLARKGYLTINEQEAQIVRLAFDIYLEKGSVVRTAEILNSRGYRTKAYTSRRGKPHPSARFVHSRTYKMLTNLAYIGKKEICKSISGKPWKREVNDNSPYRVVDAVWPGIVDPEKFAEVQKLLKLNCQTRNNGSAPTKHFYLLNGGLLYCHKCGAKMVGRNGHGHKGRKAYFYYYCTNKACRLKYSQEEIENAAGELVQHVSKKQNILKKVIAKLNHRLRKSFPKIEADKREKEIELRRVSDEAQRLLSSNNWSQEAKGFVDEQLRKLGDARKHLEEGLARLRSEVSAMNASELTELDVKGLLDDVGSAIFDNLKPYQRKELLYNSVRRFEISNEALRANVKLQTASLNPEWSNAQPAFSEPSQGAI